MKNILLLLSIAMASIVQAQTARVQFIHNSPDILTEAVDIYFGNQKVVDSIYFRSASPYFDVNASTNTVVAVQTPSLPDTVASLHRDAFMFDADSTYVIVISGIISTTPYDSLKPFELAMTKGRQRAGIAGGTDVLFYHGGTDTPPLDFNEVTQPISGLVTNLQYGEFSNMIELDPIDYEIDMINVSEQNLMATYLAPFNTWGLADSGLVIVVSGFVDTIQNMPGDTNSAVEAPLVGLWAALPGGGPLLELPIISGIGLDELSNGLTRIYPVPAENYITIEKAESLKKPLWAEIVTLNGQSVFKSNIIGPDENNFRLDVTEIRPGFYMLILENDYGMIMNRKIYIR